MLTTTHPRFQGPWSPDSELSSSDSSSEESSSGSSEDSEEETDSSSDTSSAGCVKMKKRNRVKTRTTQGPTMKTKRDKSKETFFESYFQI